MTDQLSKYRNTIILIVVLIVAAALGYLWGSASVRIENTGLWQLGTSYQAIYVQSVADAYADDANDALAAQRLSFLCQENGGLEAALAQAQQPDWYGGDPVKSANIDQLRTLVQSGQIQPNADVAVCNTRGIDAWARIGRIAAPLLLLLIALGLGGYTVLMGGGSSEAPSTSGATTTAAPAAPSIARPSFGRKEPPPAAETVPSKPITKEEAIAEAKSVAQAGAKLSQAVEKTDFEALGQDPPIVQFMTTFLHGDDLYDDSFSIETSSGEFLGETGVGISETLGAGSDAKQVTALEVWLFDKNDIRTVTKVLMSDHAFTDDALRAKLAPKGEAVHVEPGKKILLDTATLRVQARIVDLSYKADAMPPKSVIDRITIELAAWQREGQAAPRPPFPGGAPGGGTPPSGLPRVPGAAE